MVKCESTIVGAFNQEKVLIGTFSVSVIVKTVGSFAALLGYPPARVLGGRHTRLVTWSPSPHPTRCNHPTPLKYRGLQWTGDQPNNLQSTSMDTERSG